MKLARRLVAMETELGGPDFVTREQFDAAVKRAGAVLYAWMKARARGEPDPLEDEAQVEADRKLLLRWRKQGGRPDFDEQDRARVIAWMESEIRRLSGNPNWSWHG